MSWPGSRIYSFLSSGQGCGNLCPDPGRVATSPPRTQPAHPTAKTRSDVQVSRKMKGPNPGVPAAQLRAGTLGSAGDRPAGPGTPSAVPEPGQARRASPGVRSPNPSLGVRAGPAAGGAASGRTGPLETKARERLRSRPRVLLPGQVTLSSPGHRGTPRGRPRVQAFGRPSAPHHAVGWGGNWRSSSERGLGCNERAGERAARLRLPPSPKRLVQGRCVACPFCPSQPGFLRGVLTQTCLW